MTTLSNLVKIQINSQLSAEELRKAQTAEVAKVEAGEVHVKLRKLTTDDSVQTVMEAVHAALTAIYKEHGVTPQGVRDDDEGWQNTGYWVGDFKATMTQVLGLTFMGAGCFAGVWLLPDGENVLKVGLKLDDAGASWAAYCRANPSAFVPEIKALRRFSNCYMVVMPRYESYSEVVMVTDPHERVGIDLAYHMAYSAVEHGNLEFVGTWLEDFVELQEGRDHMKVASLVARSFLLSEYAMDIFRDVGVVGQQVHEYFTGSCFFDLHDENVMYVKDAGFPGGYRIIITDPMSWSRSTDDAWSLGDVLQDAREVHLR